MEECVLNESSGINVPAADSWQELGCTGSRPPPLERFSFDKIDSHRALLFGGKRGLFTAGFSDIYILDLDIMVHNLWRMSAFPLA